jgi:transcriptional regulator with XRE-family HTH domain
MTPSQRHTAPPFRRIREAHGLTLAEVAERVGCTGSHLSRVERGLVRPSVDVLYRLTVALGMRDERQALRPLVGAARGR